MLRHGSYFFIVAITLLCSTSFAQTISQQRINTSIAAELEALKNAEDYNELSFLLQKVKSTDDWNPSWKYFEVLTTLKLQQEIAPAIQFINETANDQQRQLLISEIGKYLYQKSNIEQALSYLKKLDQPSGNDLFIIGLIYLEKKDYATAIKHFESIPSNQLTEDIKYHKAITYWELNDKYQAVELFKELVESDKYAPTSIRILATYRFDQKDFPTAIKYATQSLKAGAHSDPSLLLIKGTSHYYLNEFGPAAKALNQIWTKDQNLLSEEQTWMLAEAYLQSNKKSQAIKPLELIIQKEGQLAQMAAFKLGEIELAEAAYMEAVNSFQKASLGDNQQIIKTAKLNMGKAYFNAEFYDEAIQSLNQYRSTYPRSNTSEVNNLITQSYFQNSNFEETIQFIESNKDRSSAVREIYQQVTYSKGLQSYNDQFFGKSIEYLKKSIANPVDANKVRSAYLLIAEAYFLLNEYNQAKSNYEWVLASGSRKQYAAALYGLGYVLYEQKDYSAALERFLAHNEQDDVPLDRLTEVDTRIADCYFMLKKYAEAERYYSRLKKSAEKDHVLFQLARTYQLNGSPKKAKKVYQTIVNDEGSGLLFDDAAFLLGQMLIDESDYQAAITSFNQLLNQEPESMYVSRVLIEKALAYTNEEMYDSAAIQYKNIIDKHPASSEVNDAILGLQSLQNNGYEVADFQMYFQKVKMIMPGNTQLIEVAYEQAKTAYYQFSYEKAIIDLQSFIQSYPSTIQAAEATYYLADSYYRQEKWEGAIISLKAYLEGKHEMFRSRALERLAKSYVEMGQLDDALLGFKKWNENATNNRELYFSNIGILNIYRQKKEIQKAREIIAVIENSPWKPINSENTLSMIKSELFLEANDTDQATDELLKVMNSEISATSAQAHFQYAMILSKNGQYAQSNETLFVILSDFASYRIWRNKAYLLLIDNYLQLDNMVQATATAESILQNSEDQELLDAVSQKLKAISQQSIVEIDTLKAGGKQ